jgi:hypothetical protein
VNYDIGYRSHVTLNVSTATCNISLPSDKESLSGKKNKTLQTPRQAINIKNFPLPVFHFVEVRTEIT